MMIAICALVIAVGSLLFESHRQNARIHRLERELFAAQSDITTLKIRTSGMDRF